MSSDNFRRHITVALPTPAWPGHFQFLCSALQADVPGRQAARRKSCLAAGVDSLLKEGLPTDLFLSQSVRQ